MRGEGPVIVWFQQDLRLADNAALAAAAATGAPVLPVYVLDDVAAGAWRMGAASRWWLHYSLGALEVRLRKLGAPLILLRGRAEPVLLELAKRTGAAAVLWNEVAEPAAATRDHRFAAALRQAGVRAESLSDTLWPKDDTESSSLHLPFTAYWRRKRAAPPAPLPAPRRLTAFIDAPEGERLMGWRLTPAQPDRADGLRECWTPGEAAAQERLAAFIDGTSGDRAGLDAGSRLSPHLRFGELSARQVWAAAQPIADRPEGEAFLRQLGWREFGRRLLRLAPTLPDRALKPDFDAVPWRRDEAALDVWRRGRTGYPLVDAGMRELRRTGFMPNRVRMVAASFLVKHLLIDWREGERWFWETLVDADLASNAMN